MYKMKEVFGLPKLCGQQAGREIIQLQTRAALMEVKVTQKPEPRALENHTPKARLSPTQGDSNAGVEYFWISMDQALLCLYSILYDQEYLHYEFFVYAVCVQGQSFLLLLTTFKIKKHDSEGTKPEETHLFPAKLRR